MYESSISSVHRFVRYTPGRSVHWVQARRAWMDKHISELPRGEIVSLEERWHLMKFGSRGGHYCICIADNAGVALSACVDPAAVPQPTSVEEFVEQSLKFGGANLRSQPPPALPQTDVRRRNTLKSLRRFIY